jgi:carboxypeptidase PM20D1
LVHQKLELRIVNNYSLLYEWKGTEASLLPGLFVAHFDVVPTEGMGNWEHPPFSGHIDGDFIWGRGALDNKSQMMGMLESVEDLLRQNISPRRTLFFAFGHDEESGGDQGAGQIKSHFSDRDLKFEFILDEGGAMMKDVFPGTSAIFAFIGTAEKGYLDIGLSVRTVGGHSSVPPMENAIEIL